MRGKKVLLAIALGTGMATGASAAMVTDYQFNDVAGTALQSLVNGGSDANTFSWNNGDVTTDGAGSLVVTNKSYLGHDLYSSSIASGVVTYEIGISSWDFTVYSSTNANIEPAMFEIGASGGTHTDRIRLGFKIDAGGNVVIRSDGVYLESNIGLPAASTDGIRFRQVVDLDTDTYAISYQRYSDGATWTDWNNGAWGRGDITGIKMMQPEGTWSAGDQVSYDYLTIDAIPEPATLWLIAFCGVAIGFIRRKFMI